MNIRNVHGFQSYAMIRLAVLMRLDNHPIQVTSVQLQGGFSLKMPIRFEIESPFDLRSRQVDDLRIVFLAG
jgi:hypothetical protein